MLDKLEPYIPTIIIVSPIIVTFLLYYGNKLLYKHQWRAIHFTVQWSAIVYFISVMYMIERRTPFIVTGYVINVLLLSLAFLLIKQWKKDTEVVLSKALKLLSRILFLLCFVLYFILIVLEMIQLI